MGLQVQFHRLCLPHQYASLMTDCGRMLPLVKSGSMIFVFTVTYLWSSSYGFGHSKMGIWACLQQKSLLFTLWKWGNREPLEGGNQIKSTLEALLSALFFPTIFMAILLRTQFTCISRRYRYIAPVSFDFIKYTILNFPVFGEFSIGTRVQFNCFLFYRKLWDQNTDERHLLNRQNSK